MATGPLYGRTMSPAPNSDTLVWAHNTAAWVGVAVCLFLIFLWFRLDATVWAEERKAKRDGDQAP